jgi:hypothetical protein
VPNIVLPHLALNSPIIRQVYSFTCSFFLPILQILLNFSLQSRTGMPGNLCPAPGKKINNNTSPAFILKQHDKSFKEAKHRKICKQFIFRFKKNLF